MDGRPALLGRRPDRRAVHRPGLPARRSNPATESVPFDDTADEPQARHRRRGARPRGHRRRTPPTAVVLRRYGLLDGPGTWYAPDGPAADAPAGRPAAAFLGALDGDDAACSLVAHRSSAVPRRRLLALDYLRPGGPVNITAESKRAFSGRDSAPGPRRGRVRHRRPRPPGLKPA
ncbi:hypothetical protein ACU686_35900 [Yinghuangia aomiensis]